MHWREFYKNMLSKRFTVKLLWVRFSYRMHWTMSLRPKFAEKGFITKIYFKGKFIEKYIRQDIAIKTHKIFGNYIKQLGHL